MRMNIFQENEIYTGHEGEKEGIIDDEYKSYKIKKTYQKSADRQKSYFGPSQEQSS